MNSLLQLHIQKNLATNVPANTRMHDLRLLMIDRLAKRTNMQVSNAGTGIQTLERANETTGDLQDPSLVASRHTDPSQPRGPIADNDHDPVVPPHR